MKPATDLPWRIYSRLDTLEISPPEPSGLGERPAVVFWQGFDGNGLTKRANSKNAAYIVHTANAYPTLVAALKEIARCIPPEGNTLAWSMVQIARAAMERTAKL